jgi:hypothetical protein
MRIGSQALGVVVPGVAEFVPARFAVPQNPVGMGDVSSDLSAWVSDIQAGNISNMFTDTILSVPVWGWLIGAYVAVSLLDDVTSGTRYVKRKAKAAYKA